MGKRSDIEIRCVKGIQAYIGDLQQIITDSNIQSFQDLKKSLAPKYAVTQLITNIYELSKELHSDTLQSLVEFSKINIRVVRQLASHKYKLIDFKPVFATCLQLTSESVSNELTKFQKEAHSDC